MSLRLIILVICLSSCSSGWCAPPARYVARFANGNIVEGNTLRDWHSPESTPKLENQALFDAGNPLRWLIDRTQPLPEPSPDAFVEMVTGDRLPGNVFDYRTGEESPYQTLPPHLHVAYQGPSAGSLDKQTYTVRVDLRFVKKIQWAEGGTDRWTPRTIYLRDGTFLSFRAMRWAPGGVSVLLESGPRRIAFSEMAQIHLPVESVWDRYLDELAILTPEGDKRLVQFETMEGGVVTASLSRILPRVLGDAKDISRWLLGVQPAWSLDLIWLWQGTIRTRRSFAPHEVPLTRVAPVRTQHRSAFEVFTSDHALNVNLRGHPLRSGQREAGWGYAVQAFSELEFELPAIAKTIRSDFGLDSEMESGGCVQARILNASAGNATIYQSQVVVGSDGVVDSGAVGISGGGDGPRRVVLQVDPVITNRPPNADPFDVRDQANWLDPLVELDQTILKQQLGNRGASMQLAWSGWTVALENGAQLTNVNVFAEAGNSGDYRLGAAVSGSALKLAKQHVLQPHDRWLVLDAVRLSSAGPACKLQVKVGDAMPVEWDVPPYDKSRTDFRPLIIALQPEKKEVSIEVKIPGTSERVPVAWRGIAVVRQHPMIHTLFDEAIDLDAQEVTMNATAVESDQSHSGKRLIAFGKGQEVKLQLKKPIAIRERPQLGEHRFLRFAVRKRGGGTMRIGVQNAGDREPPVGYFAGPNPEAELAAKRISDQPIPDQWQIVTRDLYGDFGDFELSAVTFQTADGEEAFVDHVYLARTQSDFELTKQLLPAK